MPRPQHRFHPSSPCLCGSDSSPVTLLFVNSVSTSLACSFYYSLFSPTIVCAVATFCIKAFFPAKSPDRLLLVKGALARFKIKTNVKWFSLEPPYRIFMCRPSLATKHKNRRRKKSRCQSFCNQEEVNQMSVLGLRLTHPFTTHTR